MIINKVCIVLWIIGWILITEIQEPKQIQELNLFAHVVLYKFHVLFHFICDFASDFAENLIENHYYRTWTTRIHQYIHSFLHAFTFCYCKKWSRHTWTLISSLDNMQEWIKVNHTINYSTIITKEIFSGNRASVISNVCRQSWVMIQL